MDGTNDDDITAGLFFVFVFLFFFSRSFVSVTFFSVSNLHWECTTVCRLRRRNRNSMYVCLVNVGCADFSKFSRFNSKDKHYHCADLINSFIVWISYDCGEGFFSRIVNHFLEWLTSFGWKRKNRDATQKQIKMFIVHKDVTRN